MNITEAASILRSGTAWNYSGTVLTQADDGTPRVSVPEQFELDALIAKEAYIELRQKEYPPMADQLDAIWKGGQDMEAMRSRIDSVKAKYPKG